jgi:hypothetical protein
MEIMKDLKLTETEIEVLKIVESRWKIGRERYGKGLSYDPGTVEQWLEQAIEECADQLQYLVAMRIRIERTNKIND